MNNMAPFSQSVRLSRCIGISIVLLELTFLTTICQAKSPNFVVILTDDQSWVGSSLTIDPNDERTRSDYYRTPNIERLAKLGMRFTRGYAPAPFCCPTRRSLVIGQTPAKHIYQKDQKNWTTNYRRQLSLPRMLKAANSAYQTAHFGKWDSRFDEVTPEEMGYDVSDGLTGNGTGGGKGSGGPSAKDDPKLIHAITTRAMKFMEEQANAETPFFVQVSHYAVHLDIFYRQDSLDAARRWDPGKKHTMPEFAAMTSDVDAGIGTLLDKIANLGIRDNTYIFFLSDNGGRLSMPGQPEADFPRNYPLREGKGTMYEGGIRVPFICIGPGIETGSISHVPVTGLDLFPTMADLAGFPEELPASLDGGSLTNVFRKRGGGTVERAQPFLLFHHAVARKAQTAIMQGDFKLVKTWDGNRLELFDLSNSPSEDHDLSRSLPEKTQELHDFMSEFLNDVGAETSRTTTKDQQRLDRANLDEPQNADSVVNTLSSAAQAMPTPIGTGGGLKMFYDNRMYPQAVALGTTVYIVWRGEDGLPYLAAYNSQDRTVTRSQMLLANYEGEINFKKFRNDHHYAPVIWSDQNEHLHVLCGCHNSPGLHLIATNPRSTDTWITGPTFDESLSYPKVHHVLGNRTLIYYRHTGHLGRWQYRISGDGGYTWKQPARTIVDLNAQPHDAEYAAHAGSYNTTAVSADGNRLHVAFIWKVEDPVFNTRYKAFLHDHTQRYNLYYVVVDLTNGTATNIDGRPVELPLRKSTADAHCLVWDTQERVAAVGPAIALDSQDRTHFILPISEANPHAGHFYHVCYRDKSWRKTPITETLHPFNASHVQINDDGTLHAFLIAGNDADIVEEGMDEYGWGQRAELWSSDDDGQHWHFKQDLTPSTNRRYQSIQFVSDAMKTSIDDVILFYGWSHTHGPGTAYLWDGRPGQ